MKIMVGARNIINLLIHISFYECNFTVVDNTHTHLLIYSKVAATTI